MRMRVQRRNSACRDSIAAMSTYEDRSALQRLQGFAGSERLCRRKQVLMGLGVRVQQALRITGDG
eukprot:12914157-Prorocentrum_lima.AAC.1